MRESLIIPLALLAMVACRDADTDTPAEPIGDEVVQLAETGVHEVEEPVLDIVVAEYGSMMLEEGVPVSDTVELPGEEGTPVQVVDTALFELRRGETLAHFARWSELPVELIAETSELELHGSYPVGTAVEVPIGDEVALERLQRLREEHHTRRLESYLTSRGGSIGEEVISVRTGDTAWSLAHDHHGLPVWVIDQLNPEVDLERLVPGDRLVIPVLADVVAEAPTED